MCANLCCCKLKLDVARSLELEERTDVRALEVKARCIVMGKNALER